MMNKIIVPITGMHCRSCEMLIEENISQLSNVTKVRAKYQKGIVEIHYADQKPDNKDIDQAIRSAGYSIGEEKKSRFVSLNGQDYKDLGIALLFLLGAYWILKSLGLTNLNFSPSSSSPENLWIVLLVGLTAGVSSCMALVGGLVLGLSTRHAEKHPEASSMEKFRPHVYFNLGRVFGFALLGGILGIFGSLLQIDSFSLGILTILVGIIMLLMGLQLIGIFPIVNSIKLTLPKFISRALGVKDKPLEYNNKSSLILGALTFFLPCGFTQAMQLYAVSTGNFLGGALVMGTFALGTVPGLLGIGGLTSIVRGALAGRFFKLAGILVIFFALFNISNGYTLTGWPAGFNNSTTVSGLGNDPNVTLENGVQIVKMTQSGSGYSPNKFTIKKGIPVKWVINSTEPYSCASSLTIPALGISKKLMAGENTIEFTPTAIGALKFSCSMGMYTGVFNVIDSNGSSVNSNDFSSPSKSASSSCSMPSGSGGGGCGRTANSVQSKEGTVEPENSLNNSGPSNENSQTQIINSTYTLKNDISPNTFTVKVGQPVKFVIDAKENGQGCMSTIMIPGLYDNSQPIIQGKLEMDFTPTKPGTYQITCAMGVPRGTIKVTN